MRDEPQPTNVARVRRELLVGLGVAAVLAPLLLAVARWPRYWAWIASEQTPMTWLQSVVLVLSSAAALLLAVLLRLRGDAAPARRPWQVLAVGFAALAVDERFALHERVRDGVLAPRGIRAPFLPWVAPGDFLVMVIALTGLAVLPLVLRGLSGDRTARVLFLLGVGLSAIAVGTDSINPATWSLETERAQQSMEEVVELAAGLCLLGAVLLRLLSTMFAQVLTETPAPPDAPRTTARQSLQSAADVGPQ